MEKEMIVLNNQLRLQKNIMDYGPKKQKIICQLIFKNDTSETYKVKFQNEFSGG